MDIPFGSGSLLIDGKEIPVTNVVVTTDDSDPWGSWVNKAAVGQINAGLIYAGTLDATAFGDWGFFGGELTKEQAEKVAADIGNYVRDQEPKFSSDELQAMGSKELEQLPELEIPALETRII